MHATSHPPNDNNMMASFTRALYLVIGLCTVAAIMACVAAAYSGVSALLLSNNLVVLDNLQDCQSGAHNRTTMSLRRDGEPNVHGTLASTSDMIKEAFKVDKDRMLFEMPQSLIRQHASRQAHTHKKDASSGDPCGWAQTYMGPNVTSADCPKCLANGCLRWIDDDSFCIDCRARVENYNYTYPTCFAILFVFALNYVVRQIRLYEQGHLSARVSFSPFFIATWVIMFSSICLAISSSSMWAFDGRLSLGTYLYSYSLGYGVSTAPEIMSCLALLVFVYYNTKSKHGNATTSKAIKNKIIVIPIMVIISIFILYCWFGFLGVSLHLSKVLLHDQSSTFSQKATILAYVARGLVLISLIISIPPCFVRLTKIINMRLSSESQQRFWRYRICFFALVSFSNSAIHLIRMLIYQYKYKDHLLFFTFDLLEFSRIAELVGMANVLYLADSTFNDYPLEELFSLLAGNLYRNVTTVDLYSDTTGARTSRTAGSSSGTSVSKSTMHLSSVANDSIVHDKGTTPASGAPPVRPARRTDFSRRKAPPSSPKPPVAIISYVDASTSTDSEDSAANCAVDSPV